MREGYERIGEGLVVEDLSEGSGLLKVLPYASSTNMGTTNLLKNTIKLGDEEEIDGSSFIVAKWLSTNSNIRTPPYVTAGSRVVLYKSLAGDEYYWTEELAQLDKRKLEEVTFMLSNRREGENSPEEKPLNICNYAVTFSTLNKTIRIDTDNNDEEPAKYIINLDTKNGLFIIEDDLKNLSLLNSPEGNFFRLTFNSLNYSSVEKNELYKGDTIKYTQGSQVDIVDGTKLGLFKDAGIKGEKCALDIQELFAYVKTLDLNVSDEVLMNLGKLLLSCASGKVEVLASEFNVMAPTTTFTGAVNVAGGIVVNSFSVGGASPKVVNPKPSKAKELKKDPYDDSKKKVVDLFNQFEENDDDKAEASETNESESPQDQESKQPEPEKPTEFKAEVDMPMSLKSKATVTVEGTAGLALKGGGIDLGQELSTLCTTIGALGDSVNVCPPNGPNGAVTAIVREFGKLQVKLAGFIGGGAYSMEPVTELTDDTNNEDKEE